jgi:hypothetical protein
MNERIRELWSQAGGHYDSGNQHTWPQYTIDDPEKFAELIVAECLKIAKTREDEFESAGLLDESNAVGNVAYRISRQFGVKR